MNNSIDKSSLNSKKQTAAAIIAFAAAAGYVIRMISHYTYYVIKIKYDESLIYGLLPAVIVAAFGILLFINKKVRPVFTSIPVAALAIYTIALMFVNNDPTDQYAQSGAGASAGSIALIILTAIMYILTCTGVLKSKVPAIVFNSLSIALYSMLVIVTVVFYVSSGDPVGTYYGYVTAPLGLALFFVSSLIALTSMGTVKKKKETENAE